MTVAAVKALIVLYSCLHGISPLVTLEMVRLESDYCETVEGDNGLAVGLWQWHKPSWDIVRRHMGKPTTDLRANPVASTKTAMHAIKVMGLGKWWSTWSLAHINTAPSCESMVRLRRVQYEEEIP